MVLRAVEQLSAKDASLLLAAYEKVEDDLCRTYFSNSITLESPRRPPSGRTSTTDWSRQLLFQFSTWSGIELHNYATCCSMLSIELDEPFPHPWLLSACL